jgi:hypothetical protein
VSHTPLAHDALPVAPGATTLQALPVSTRQAALQPPPALVPPSSQPSPLSSAPLPQVLAASHTPAPPPLVSHTPLAHEALPVAPGAVALQALPVSMKHVALQPLPLVVPPSSQPSPASRAPLPQVLAASHTPAPPPLVSHTPLAQEVLPVAPAVFALHALPVSTRQLALQPLPLVVPPSSHPSPGSSVPLPQTAGVM